MKKEDIQYITEKYLHRGVIKGGEFLLPPKYIIQLIEDLANAGILIVGCDLWRYLDQSKDPKRIVALVGAGMLVEDPDLPETMSSELSAKQIKDFVINRMPKDAELVSLIFMDSEIYDFFRSKSTF